MTGEEYEAEMKARDDKIQRDRFAQAALTGLLASPHFEPGGKKSADALVGVTKENLDERLDAMRPTEDDMVQYLEIITDLSWEIANAMLEKRDG